MLVLGAADAKKLLEQLDVRAIVAGALARYSAGDVVAPPRLQVHTIDGVLESLVMPGWVGPLGGPAGADGRNGGAPDAAASLGLKVVNSFLAPGPGARSQARATIMVFDPASGAVEGIVEATHLTAVRTAMMTRLAFEYAAPAEARVVAMLGSGVQADAHVPILLDSLPAIAELRVNSRLHRNAVAFAESTRARAAARGIELDVVAVETPALAVEGAEVVIAATTAETPLFDDAAVAAGALLCSVGSHEPDHAEIPDASVARASSVIVDTRSGGIYGAGDISRPLAAGRIEAEAIVELGELVLGRRTLPSRPAAGGADGAPVVFKSIGTAAVDLPLASLLVAQARADGLGHEVVVGE